MSDIDLTSRAATGANRLLVFLCHTHGDKPAVRDLYHRLAEEPGIAPWLDEENLLPGQEWRREIPKVVRKAHIVLVCLSRKSINRAGYVQTEIRTALDAAPQLPPGSLYIVPARLEKCEVPDELAQYHWVDLFEEPGYERLMRTLRSRADKLGLHTASAPRQDDYPTELEVSAAVDRGDLRLYLQPTYELARRALVAMEAFVRWYNLTRGPSGQDTFSPTGTGSGGTPAIGRWVLREACRQAASWPRHPSSNSPIVVSVNLSAAEFYRPDLLTDVSATLTATALDHRALQLEIPEDILMDDAAATVATLRGLKSLGVKIAIDRFGTGYSSISFLRRLPVDVLKLDPDIAYFAGRGMNWEETNIAQLVVEFARDLGMRSAAVGVEAEGQLEWLCDVGYEQAQGDFLGKPGPANEVTASLLNYPDSFRLSLAPLQADTD